MTGDTINAGPQLDVTRHFVAEYLRARDLRDEAVSRMEHAADVILELMDEFGQCEIEPGVGVRVMPSSQRFNAERARQSLDAKTLALISKPTPDAALAREILDPATLALTMIDTRPALRLLAQHSP